MDFDKLLYELGNLSKSSENTDDAKTVYIFQRELGKNGVETDEELIEDLYELMSDLKDSKNEYLLFDIIGKIEKNGCY